MVARRRLLRTIAVVAGSAALVSGAYRWLCLGKGALLREPETPLATRVIASPNYSARRGCRQPDMILLHYTGMADAAAALRWLANPAAKVSAHYFVHEDGEIIQMVSEAQRAWHAGASLWAGERDINSVSIGIEIHNAGHAAADGLPPYARAQMNSVATLCRDIAARWSVPSARILAHSDVAPERKVDPGEHFDWRWLAAQGVGVWVPPAPLGPDAGLGPGSQIDEVAALKAKLSRVGYGVSDGPAYDERTEAVVAAFQRRFRPERIDGRADVSTRETLDRLIAALDAFEVS